MYASFRSAKFMDGVYCFGNLGKFGEMCLLSTDTMLSGQKRRRRIVEKLWQEFFSYPSRWWDHRPEKSNPRYPDFKHKSSRKSLWLVDSSNPPWVETELAAMPPGALQLNIYSWNMKIARYVKASEYRKAIELFQQIRQQGTDPDKYTFVPVLNACSGLGDLEQGRCTHLHIIKTGHNSDVYVNNCLVDMYAKCGSIEDARRVFDKMPKRDLVSWTCMIQGYVKCGQGQKALEVFQQMHARGLQPDPVTFVGVLNACATLTALEEGRRVHGMIIGKGYDSNIFIGSSLVDMYAKCGSIEEAWRVFSKMPTHDVVTWNAMIVGYVKCGPVQRALELFQHMHLEGVEPNPVTFVGVLNACATLVALEEGQHVHKELILRGYESDNVVGSCLVNMYAKCGNVADAWRVFNKIPTRNVISWTALIHGFVKCGQGQKALELFDQMLAEGVEPNSVTFVGVLNACSSLVALEDGHRIHKAIIERGYESHIFVCNSLIDMYAKCGSLEDAWNVFSKMPTHSVVSWNAMLGGYAMHGHAKEVLGHFELMSQEGIAMNGVTFANLLSACSHAGLINEGLHFFESMGTCYNVSASMEHYHYACMVDLLGRAGRLHEAEYLIKTVRSCDQTTSLWMALLGACRVHSNLEMGESVAKQVLELDPTNAAGYVLLSSMYAEAGD